MEFLYMLEKIRTPFLNSLMQLFTYFGQELVGIGIVCVFFWCIDKRFGYRVGFAFFGAGLFLQAFKISMRIERPWVLDPEFKPVESALGAATGYSFPSGHSQAAATVFTGLATKVKKVWIKVVFIVLLLLVGFSRMYLGVHTPADVIVGIVLGVLSMLVFDKVFKILGENTDKDWIVLIAMLLLSIGIAVYSIIFYKDATIDLKSTLDCCKAAGAGFGFAFGWFFERKYVKFDEKMPKVWYQVIKMAVGIGVALALKELPKLIFGKDIIAVDMIRYAIVVFWVVCVYPWLVEIFRKKYLSKKNERV